MTPHQRLYDSLNLECFHGRLPRYSVRLRFLAVGGGAMHYGLCDDERRIIWLRPGMDPERLRRVLLHEMCHVGGGGHGKKWQDRMLRLAKKGEQWAAEEVESYRFVISHQPRTTKANIRETLREWVISREAQECPWRKIWKELAGNLGCSQRDIRDLRSWTHRLWKRLIAEQQAFTKQQEKLKRLIAADYARRGLQLNTDE